MNDHIQKIKEEAEAYAKEEDCGFCQAMGNTTKQAWEAHEASKNDATALDIMRKQKDQWDKVHEIGSQQVQKLRDSMKEPVRTPPPPPAPEQNTSSSIFGLIGSNGILGRSANTEVARIRPLQHFREINTKRPKPLDMITGIFK